MKNNNLILILLLVVTLVFLSSCKKKKVDLPWGYQKVKVDYSFLGGVVPSVYLKRGDEKINLHVSYHAPHSPEFKKLSDSIYYGKTDDQVNFILRKGEIHLGEKYKFKNNPNRILIEKAKKHVFLDSNGNFLKEIAHSVYRIDSSYSLVRLSYNKWEILNINTFETVEDELTFDIYEDKSFYRTGNATFITDSSGRYAYYHTKKGKMTNHIFSHALPFHDGMALVDIAGDKKGYGYIDNNFNFIIEPGFLDDFFAEVVEKEWLQRNQIMTIQDYKQLYFSNDFARYFIVVNGQKKWGYVDKCGRIRLPAHYSSLPRWKRKGVEAERDGNPVWIDHL